MEFTVEKVFNVPAEILFKAWLNSEEHTKMTGGEASADEVIGSVFTAWDGYIYGKNIEIKPSKYIKQSWRTSEFSDNESDSIVEIEFSEKNGKSIVKIVHTNLPAHGMQYEQGWKDHYFTPMTEYFESE